MTQEAKPCDIGASAAAMGGQELNKRCLALLHHR